MLKKKTRSDQRQQCRSQSKAEGEAVKRIPRGDAAGDVVQKMDQK
jgi:hypothetical protein